MIYVDEYESKAIVDSPPGKEKKDMMNGYAITGTPLPISLGGGGDDGYTAGNIGLNYLFPKWPNAPLNPNSNYCENETESGFDTGITGKVSPAVSNVIDWVVVILILILLVMFLNKGG